MAPPPARGRRAPPTLRPPRLGVPVRRSHWPLRSVALRPLAEAGSGEPCAQRRGGVSRGAVCTPRVAQAAGPAAPSERAELSRAGAAAVGNRTAGTAGGLRGNRRGAAGGPAGPRGGSEGTARDGDGAGALRPSARESTAGRAPAPFPALRRAGEAVKAARAVRAAGLERAAAVPSAGPRPAHHVVPHVWGAAGHRRVEVSQLFAPATGTDGGLL
ncbi:unnamed protein product [Coccothraustes coccothraustes]